MFKKENLVYFIFLIIFISTIAFSGYNLYKCYSDKESSTNSISFMNSARVNYSVNIKDNSFINNRVLPMGKTYITELVENIKMTMEYSYSSEADIPMLVDHQIIATISGLYNENPNSTRNPIIWEKDYIIKSITKEEFENKSFKITESFDLDLSIYNDEANRFKTVFSIPTIAYLEIKMPINLIGENDDYSVKDNYMVFAKIPLTEKVFHVDTNENDETEKLITSKNSEEFQIDQRKFSIYLVIFVSSLILLLITIKKLLDSNDKEEFNSYIDGIKKDYNEIIVETDNMVDANDLQPIVITSFEEMLNLATSLEMPIILYEEENLAVFYIVKNGLIYSYLLRRTKKDYD